MRSSSTPSFYGDNQTYISHPPPGYSRPAQGPSPYYPGMIPPSYPNYYRNGYNENCSHTSSSIPTLSTKLLVPIKNSTLTNFPICCLKKAGV